jgi:hypothetical protein
MMPRIALNYLYYPIEEGSLNLLDIKLRNEVIETTWLKSYLNISPTRPIWAKVANIIIDKAALSGYNAQARVNTFLQTWNASTRGPRAMKLNKDIIRMLKAGRDHNVNFTAIKLTLEQKQKLLAWFQIRADHNPITNKVAKCLLYKHKTKTVTDLIRTSARIRNNNECPIHRQMNYCNCCTCRNDQENGCTYP